MPQNRTPTSRQYTWLTLPTALFMGVNAAAAMGHVIPVGNFETGTLSGWEEKVFNGKTIYGLTSQDVGRTLKADSRGTASGLFKKIQIDLTKTPCLSWSWKVDNVLHGLDETTKAGDDYPARVYVVFSGGAFFWNTRALNYVWSSGQPLNSAWPNAYTANTINIAVQSGDANIGQWIHQSRNIRDDYQRLVGKDVTQADAIAIMTDTDNSGREATAYYGNISLSSSCI